MNTFAIAVGAVWVCTACSLGAAPERQKAIRSSDSVSLLQPFEPYARCSDSDAHLQQSTISQVLGPNVKGITIVWFRQELWRDETVQLYLDRILNGSSEGIFAHPAWSELPVREILASIEFQDGRRRRLELSNGYAHFEDESGCQWWARYLGPDRSKWIVRR
jgi:hypothetical protein